MPKKNQLQRYLKEKKINSGCYGTVYLARDTKEKRLIVIKQVKAQYQSDLIKEIHFMRALHQKCPVFYPDIQQVIFDHRRDQLQMIMEYYPWTLSDLMDHDPDRDYLMHVFQQIMEAYVVMECNMICHFDLKPENILIDWQDRELPQIKIIDFGFAEYYHTGARNTLICTDYYRPPELFDFKTERVYGAEVDLWSIGVILLEYFIGEHVFRGKTDEDILIDIHAKLPRLSKYDTDLYSFHPDLGFVINGFLRLEPEERWTTYIFIRDCLSKSLEEKYEITVVSGELLDCRTSDTDRYQLIDNLKEPSGLEKPVVQTFSEVGDDICELRFHDLGALPISSDKICRKISEELLDHGTPVCESPYLEETTNSGLTIEELTELAEKSRAHESECKTSDNHWPQTPSMLSGHRGPLQPLNSASLHQQPDLDKITSDYQVLVTKQVMTSISREQWYRILFNSLEILENLEDSHKVPVAWSSFYLIIIKYLNHHAPKIGQRDLYLNVVAALYLVYEIFYYQPYHLSDFLDITEIYLKHRFSKQSVRQHQQYLIKFL